MRPGFFCSSAVGRHGREHSSTAGPPASRACFTDRPTVHILPCCRAAQCLGLLLGLVGLALGFVIAGEPPAGAGWLATCIRPACPVPPDCYRALLALPRVVIISPGGCHPSLSQPCPTAAATLFALVMVPRAGGWNGLFPVHRNLGMAATILGLVQVLPQQAAIALGWGATCGGECPCWQACLDHYFNIET